MDAEPGGAEKAQAVDGGGRAELEKLELLPYAAERRKRLLEALGQLEAEIAALDRQVAEEVKQTAGGGAVDDASGSGAGDGVGHGADAGAGGALRESRAKWAAILG
jgi:hypothetical protein